jgi:hypothetical protein
VVTEQGALAQQVRSAYQGADLETFGALLADNVRWGDDDHPYRCRSRDEVLRTFADWVGPGRVTADVIGVDSGPFGVLCRLHVNWVNPKDRARGTDFIHVLMTRDGLVTEIRRYDDLESATTVITTG